MAVSISLSKKIPSHLLKGNIVDLDELGALSVNLSSKGSIIEDDFETSMIRGLKINYRPAQAIRSKLKMAIKQKKYK